MAEARKKAGGAEAPQCLIEFLARGGDLEKHRAEWAELAGNAVEPNPFYEPFALLPALRWLDADQDVRVLLIWAKIGGERRLAGLLPLTRAPLTPWLPLQAWTPWQHKYCFLASPLIHGEYAELVSKALLDWLGANGGISVLACVGGGAFEQALNREASALDLGLAEAERRYRALFQAGESAETYLVRSVSGRHRKGYRRLERHLATHGKLDYRAATDDQALDTWVEDFLRLEAAGWKGRVGTAFADSAAERAYFRELVQGAHASGRAMALGLYLNGKPVALKVNFLCVEGAFSFKICYDEAYARYSPGVLLELENIREMHRLGVVWMDSCADEDHPMIDRLWPERREIRTLFVGRKWAGIGSPAILMAALRRWKRAASKRLRRTSKSPARASLSGVHQAEPGRASC